MANRHNNIANPQHRSYIRRMRWLYDRLARAEELLEMRLQSWSGIQRRAAGAIVHEDVVTLLEECENHLFDWSSSSPIDFQSFESRSLTVLEEATALLLIPAGSASDDGLGGSPNS